VSAEGGIPFGSYTLFRRLARGGMAEVFLARQRHLDGYDRRVAVKRILPHLSDSADFVRMFLGEARLAARLTHPNIVHIYDFGKVADEYYIAMEYVDGVHAGQLIKHAAKESLPPTLIARIGADASAALHYAHSFTDGDGKPLRLVHRDVSPPNLMVSFDGVVKLVDFGIAKATAVEQLTNPGTVKGKYAYMSPEQTTARTLDGRSDVFSLGLVLWELIAGRHIVERGNPVDAMRAIRDGKLPRIESVAPRTPRELVQALELALETDREDRASALELSQILEAYIKAAPELATAMQMATWVRSRFQPVLTGPQPSLSDPGGGTKVATSGSSAAQSVITPARDDYGARTPVVEMIDHGDTMIDASTIVGGTSTLGGSTDRRDRDDDDGDDLDNSETRIAEGRASRPRPSRTTPPPIPRKTPPARPITEDPGNDLDNDETISRAPAVKATAIMPPPPPHVRPEDRPTEIEPAARPFDAALAYGEHSAPGERNVRPDVRATVVAGEVRAMGGPGVPPLDPALSGEPTIVAGAPAPAYGSVPPGPVAAGTQTNHPALPTSDRPDPTNVDRTRPHAERTATRFERLAALDPRRRAALAAIAGGICAAVIGVVCVAARSGDDRAAAPVRPDAAMVVVTPVDAAPVTTELRIVTAPPGAVAQVGTRRGQTPITFAVDPGPVKVHIELAGHVAVDRTMQLKPGDHLVLDLTLDEVVVPVIVPPDAAPARPDRGDRVDRARKPGALSVRTTPYSDVYLGKRLLGQSPFAELSLPAGTHTLTFKHPGRRTVSRAVVITSGKTTKLNITLP
jgi:serine/threonine protein kinase